MRSLLQLVMSTSGPTSGFPYEELSSSGRFSVCGGSVVLAVSSSHVATAVQETAPEESHEDSQIDGDV